MSCRIQNKGLLAFFALAIFLLSAVTCLGESKSITAESTYLMGDGESPFYAEEMVLQKAKQAALEQAGTYVETYTLTKNYDLSSEEIQVVSAGLMQVDIMSRSRRLAGEGLQFHIVIRAQVNLENIETIAQRIRDRNAVQEYVQLRKDYIKLVRDLELWKQAAKIAGPGTDREELVARISEQQKDVIKLQHAEEGLFTRIVSGQALLGEAQQYRLHLRTLLETIREKGQQIYLGKITTHPSSYSPGMTVLQIPITLSVAPSLHELLAGEASTAGGEIRKATIQEALDGYDYILNDEAATRLAPHSQWTKGARLSTQRADILNALMSQRDGGPYTTYHNTKFHEPSMQFVKLSGDALSQEQFWNYIHSLRLVIRARSNNESELGACSVPILVNRLIAPLSSESAYSSDLVDYYGVFERVTRVRHKPVVILGTSISFQVSVSILTTDLNRLAHVIGKFEEMANHVTESSIRICPTFLAE